MSGRSVHATMQAARTPSITVLMGLKKKRTRMRMTSQAVGASQTGRERGLAPLVERGADSMGRGESGRGRSSGIYKRIREGGVGWKSGARPTACGTHRVFEDALTLALSRKERGPRLREIGNVGAGVGWGYSAGLA